MNLTKKAKIVLGTLAAGAVVVGAGLGIWQPWNQPVGDKTPDAQPDQPVTEVTKPADTVEVKVPTLTVGGNEIECRIHEGDGWTMYVPVDWVHAGDGIFKSPDGSAKLEVIFSRWNVYAGNYMAVFPVSLSNEEDVWMQRTFHAGGVEGGWEILCQARDDAWDDVHKLMTAMARTFTAEGEMVFSGFSPVASEPEWQYADGVTTMWMDKDGYVVDDVAEEYVVTAMLAWDKEYKMNFTGQYRLDNFGWSGSYTCVTGKEYIDVFRSRARYEVAEGKEESIELAGGASIRDGWLTDGFWLDVVVYHDGSAVKDVEVRKVNDCTAGEPMYLSDLVWDDKTAARPLTADELKQITDWFMEQEHNGLLRVVYSSGYEVAENLPVLFYDLGKWVDETMTDAEKDALVAAGGTLEFDTFKLTRAYVENYMEQKLGIWDGKDWLAQNEHHMPGIYLPEFDAWYVSRSDTMMGPYAFVRGEVHPSNNGSVRVYYTGDLYHADGTIETAVPMAVALTLRYDAEIEGYRWIIDSNVKAK